MTTPAKPCRKLSDAARIFLCVLAILGFFGLTGLILLWDLIR